MYHYSPQRHQKYTLPQEDIKRSNSKLINSSSLSLIFPLVASYTKTMHLHKLAILVVVAITPTAYGDECDTDSNGFCLPPSTSCYASASFLASQGKARHHSSPAIANPGLRHGNMRELRKTEATVIDYKEGSWTLPRDEVVSAVKEVIDGAGTTFQLNAMFNDTLQVLLLQQDGMLVSTEDLDGEFTLRNCFIKKSPSIEYQVNCPASDGGDMCAVKRVNQQDEYGNDLVACFTEESTITKEDIAAECGEEMYDMALYALPGPHFILAGTKSLDLDSLQH